VEKKKTNNPKKPVSRKLRDAIRDRGLTAYATAKQAGVSVDAVQRFMKNERGLTLGTVDKIAETLDLTLCDDKPSENPA
jgi:plasmid maintenance system antidote protein VapI